MPVKLSEIRSQFPMYDSVPDAQFLEAVRAKLYPDLPRGTFLQNIEFPKSDPTEGMSTFDKVAAGFGKAITDTGRGLGQMVGIIDRKDVEDARQLDAPLMNTTAGKVGDFAGNVAATLPLAFVPGANTVRGASLIGSAVGLMQPSTSTQETLGNIGLGALSGGGGVMAGRGAAAAYQAGTGLLRPLTKKGQQQIVSEILQTSATDAGRAASNLATAKPLVKGSLPTVGQVADDAGLAQLERTLYNNPESQGPLAKAYRTQLEARQKAISDIAGTPDYRKAIEDGRTVFAKQDYADAFAQGIDPQMATALQPQIDSLMKRPSIQSAKMIAKSLAAENDVALTNFGSLEGLDWVKKGLDNQISKATANGSSIGDAKLKALLQTKQDLMDTLEQIAPAYKTANDNFAGMSKNINAMDVANDLQSRLYKNANWGSNKEMGGVYQTELTKALESIKKHTGMNKSLSDVMPAGDIATLEGIARDISRKENGQNLGRAVGSPTMQNMLGQNMLQRISGPIGMPQSFSQSMLANSLARPYDFLMKSAQPNISAMLGEALSDPTKARGLLQMANTPSKVGKIALGMEKYLGLPGLLALENGQ
jgi:hypothetical protein